MSIIKEISQENNCSIVVIDYAEAVYKRINKDYDIEICGPFRKNRIALFVWNIEKSKFITERHFNLSREDIKVLLPKIIDKYKNL